MSFASAAAERGAQFSLNAETEVYEQHSGLQVYSIQSQISAPSWLTILPYDFQIGGAHGEREVRSWFYRDDVVSMNARAAIALPEGRLMANSPVSVEVKLNGSDSLEFLTGWYVSGGSLDNRRQGHTIWNTPGPGAHTIVAVARPLQGSGLLAIAVRDVMVK